MIYSLDFPINLFVFLSLLINVFSSRRIFPHGLTRAREPDCIQPLASESRQNILWGKEVNWKSYMYLVHVLHLAS